MKPLTSPSYLFIVLTFLILTPMLSCKSTAPASATQEKEETTGDTSAAQILTEDTSVQPKEESIPQISDSVFCRVMVKFISAGEGINGQARLDLERFQMKFSMDNNLPMRPLRVPRGREGEVDYCYPMIGFPEAKAREFIREVRKIMEPQPLVIIQENTRIKKPE